MACASPTEVTEGDDVVHWTLAIAAIGCAIAAIGCAIAVKRLIDTADRIARCAETYIDLRSGVVDDCLETLVERGFALMARTMLEFHPTTVVAAERVR
jgi:hypothetical protein